jgi:hypothetical protein
MSILLSPFIRYTSRMSRLTKSNHSVYMRFEWQQYWHVTFLDTDLEHELPQKLTFESPGKILELARKSKPGTTWRADSPWSER